MSSFIEEVLQALRYSVRQLRKTPGFTAVVTVTLALGIGTNTAVFSVMDAVLLRSLPVRNPQELVYLHTSDFPGGQTGYGDTSMRMQVGAPTGEARLCRSDGLGHAFDYRRGPGPFRNRARGDQG